MLVTNQSKIKKLLRPTSLSKASKQNQFAKPATLEWSAGFSVQLGKIITNSSKALFGIAPQGHSWGTSRIL
jgi:hypothetical protein